MKIAGIMFAYISLILLIILCIKPIIRKFSKNNQELKKIEIFLVKKHILISILFLINFLLHVFFSMDKTMSLYFAKISLLFLVLSIVFALLIKVKSKIFLKLHYTFSILCLIAAIIHIIEVRFF